MHCTDWKKSVGNLDLLIRGFGSTLPNLNFWFNSLVESNNNSNNYSFCVFFYESVVIRENCFWEFVLWFSLLRANWSIISWESSKFFFFCWLNGYTSLLVEEIAGILAFLSKFKFSYFTSPDINLFLWDYDWNLIVLGVRYFLI